MSDQLGEEETLGCFRFGDWVAPLTADSECSRHVNNLSRLTKWQTIFSTGLFVLEPTQIRLANVSFPVSNAFNASRFDLSTLGSTAARHVYGIQTGQLSYPVDTAENLVVQHFDLSSKLLISNYTAEVQGFSTDLDCEILPLKNATKTFLPWFSIRAPFFVVNITTDSCQIKNAIVGQGADHDYYRNNTVTENYQGRFQNFTCNTGGDSSAQYPLAGNGSMDHRFLLSMALLEWAPHKPVMQSSATWVKQLTGVLCKPTYRMDNYSVSYSNAQTTPRMEATKIPGTNTTLKGIDDSMLLKAVQASFRNTTFGQGGVDYVVTQVPSYFQVMKAMHNVSTLAPFMDPNLLQDLGSSIYKSASAQVASEQLIMPHEGSTTGSFTYTDNRLQVKRLTVGLIATFLGLLLCIGILEIYVRPWNTVSCEPQSIGALATILAASQSLRKRLVNTGSAPSDALYRWLSKEKFHTVIIQQEIPSFVLEPLPSVDGTAASQPSSIITEWWRPIAVRIWFIALIIVLPLCFIATLEILQQVSDTRNGFVDVSNSSVDSPLVSTYLPAFFAVVLGMMYTRIEFAISVFAPLAALKHGNVPANRAITVDPLGSLPPFALLSSLRSRHVAQCLAIIAAFVSSLLAIVVSALYSVESVSKHQTVFLQQADYFDLTHIDLSQDDGFAGAVTNLIAYENIPFPQWTYDNLALPSLKLSSAKNSSAINDGEYVVVTVPAIRGSLGDCSEVPQSSTDVVAMGAPASCADCNDLVQLTYNMTLPYSLCGPVSKKPMNVTWIQTYATPNDSSVTYTGTGTPLRWLSPSSDGGYIFGDGGVVNNDPNDALSSNSDLDNTMPGCPSFSYSFGMAKAGKKIGKDNSKSIQEGVLWSSEQNVSVVYCYQRLEQVMTNVTFSYPDMKINSTTPPIPLEETATVISQNNTQHWFDISLNTLINSLQELPDGIKGPNYINSFIQALSWGHDGVPLDQLYNNGDLSNLNTAANRLYGRYVAQAVSANMRASTPPNVANTIYNIEQQPSNFTGTLSQPSKRLRQNRVPKIILQAMLAFLAVCTAATYLVMDTRRVVPHNPCSIAGMMSLLAESEMCKTRDVIPEGAEWHSRSDLRRAGVFRGLLFHMGWWGGTDEITGEHGEKAGGVFGIDVVEKSEPE